jgi:hypothetical protein
VDARHKAGHDGGGGPSHFIHHIKALSRINESLLAVTHELPPPASNRVRKINMTARKSGVFSVAYKERQAHFDSFLTLTATGVVEQTTRPSKGAFRMRSEDAGWVAVPAGGFANRSRAAPADTRVRA